jgi:phenylacetate-CoA ligase
MFEAISAPSITTGAVAATCALISQFEESQWLSQEEIEKNQFKQLKNLLEYSFKYSKFYQESFSKAGVKLEDIKSLDDLKKIPILQRAEIQQAKENMDCAVVPKSHLPVWKTYTSGSTGQPLVLKKTALNQLMWNINMIRDHFWNDRDFNKRLVNIRGKIKEVTIHQNWGIPVDPIFESTQTISVPVVFSPEQQMEQILNFKPNTIILYPNTLEQLLILCEKQNINIDFIDHVMTIGETVSNETRLKTKKIWNAKVEDDYSSNEVGIMALQCPDADVYHVMAESVIIEILDENNQPCKEGKAGRVVVTSLHNYVSPIIRYEINDIAEVGGKCSCGRGLPTIKQIKGRKRNLVIKPDGTKHWPPITQEIFASKLPITNFQLIQHSLEDVEVRLVCERKLTNEDEILLTKHLHNALAHPFKLSFNYFKGLIPRPESGKFEDFMCKIPN